MKKTGSFFYGRQLLCGVLVSAAALAAVSVAGRAARVPAVPEPAAAVLASLEENDPSAVEAVLRAREESRWQAEMESESLRRAAEESSSREEENSRILESAQEVYEDGSWRPSIPKDTGNNDTAVWSRFRDYVIMGDSRAVGFYYYKFLDRSRVLAEGGETILDIRNYFGRLKSLRPSYIIFCYGLNDAGIGEWKTGEAYAASFMKVLDELRGILPDTRFIVSSVLPATDAAMRKSPSWKRIALFNASLAVACPAHGVTFVNNDGIAAQYMSTLWDEDGVHLQKAFYPYWANNLYDGVRAAMAGARPAEEPATAPVQEPEPSETPASLPEEPTPAEAPDGDTSAEPVPSEDPDEDAVG